MLNKFLIYQTQSLNIAALFLQRAFIQFLKLLKFWNFTLESPAAAVASRWPGQQRPSYPFLYFCRSETRSLIFVKIAKTSDESRQK